MDISSKSGEQFSCGGQVTKPLLPGDPPPWPNFPTVATGYTLRFAAKRKKTDATAVVLKDSVANPSEVSLANGGAYTIKIVTADTTGFTRAEELVYDVVLI